MPQKLSEKVEDKVRKHIVTNADPTAMEGYDPTQSDTTASDYILVTSDNDNYGDYYPLIWVSENENGPVIPDSGNTNVNGLQGDGSGGNQYSVFNVTIAVQAVEGGPYRNNAAYDDLVATIYEEVHSLFGVNSTLSGTVWTGKLSPPTQSRSNEEADSGSTATWVQRQGTVPVGVHFTP